MAETVIRVSNLGKKYVIGHQQKGRSQNSTLRDAITSGIKSFGSELLSRSKKDELPPKSEEFWALKDVSFEVKQGEVVGIIGRNGAGKSTLLKILSQITEPTTGEIEITGKVASLLEVGTGFHPELTGRENIFLNGAILGMSRVEIKKKFDEIVDFAEVERFIDTQVKHYSSGMYVRLAFAIAAFLEPEILILDEVLAVGDIGFQRKCIGKMDEVSRRGYTVLLVSHNVSIMRETCNFLIYLREGRIYSLGKSEEIIGEYITPDTLDQIAATWTAEDPIQSTKINFRKAYIHDEEKTKKVVLRTEEKFSICIEYELITPLVGLRIGFVLKNAEGVTVCSYNSPKVDIESIRKPGTYSCEFEFPGKILNAGYYSVMFGADSYPDFRNLILTSYCLHFSVEDVQGHGFLKERLPGILLPQITMNEKEIANLTYD
jgi:lipopolysaccharide transport system ATP-binding protein